MKVGKTIMSLKIISYNYQLLNVNLETASSLLNKKILDNINTNFNSIQKISNQLYGRLSGGLAILWKIKY